MDCATLLSGQPCGCAIIYRKSLAPLVIPLPIVLVRDHSGCNYKVKVLLMTFMAPCHPHPVVCSSHYLYLLCCPFCEKYICTSQCCCWVGDLLSCTAQRYPCAVVPLCLSPCNLSLSVVCVYICCYLLSIIITIGDLLYRWRIDQCWKPIWENPWMCKGQRAEQFNLVGKHLYLVDCWWIDRCWKLTWEILCWITSFKTTTIRLRSG